MRGRDSVGKRRCRNFDDDDSVCSPEATIEVREGFYSSSMSASCLISLASLSIYLARQLLEDGGYKLLIHPQIENC